MPKALTVTALPYSPNSAHWLTRVRDLGQPVWLDSAAPYSSRGRYDILSAAPLDTLRSDRAHGAMEDPFGWVQAALTARFKALATPAHLPFTGGAIGLFGYELGRRQMGLPEAATPSAFPDLLVGLYSWCIVSDHHSAQTWWVVRPETPAALQAQLEERLFGPLPAPTKPLPFSLTQPWHEEFGEAAYASAFERLQDYIVAGDCYQVNLARRFRARYEGDPWQAYQHLRQIAAAPFSAYLECERGAVLCLSPERLLAACDGQLLTQPIKGTAARDVDATRDAQLGQALLASAKNRAENLMIVDLLRNDLGRSCQPGSIKVEQLFELQSFATVHHLVSTISGRLRDDLQPLDALRASFPGGSITGAPKLRAMQIIDELEPAPRSVFCGALGYIGCDGRMDTNITIRTLLASQNEISAWAGGGIVADSTWEEEIAETRSKIAPLLQALAQMR